MKKYRFYKILKLFNVCISKGAIWVRYKNKVGISIKDVTLYKKTFSERNKRIPFIEIGRWRIRKLYSYKI